MPNLVDWRTKARERLQNHANECFAAWCETKKGKIWKRGMYKRHPRSPYDCGFSLPDYHDIIEALNQDNEERVKGLILQHLI